MHSDSRVLHAMVKRVYESARGWGSEAVGWVELGYPCIIFLELNLSNHYRLNCNLYYNYANEVCVKC